MARVNWALISVADPVRPGRLAGRWTTGLGGNIGAQGGAMLVQLGIQLLSVPVFLTFWSIERYGVWLILFTIPAYVATLTMGIGGAAGNAMVAAVAQDRRDDAARQFATIRGAGIAIVLAFLALVAAFLLAGGAQLFAFARGDAGDDLPWVLLALVTYALTSFTLNNWLLALRATGGYAKGLHLANTVALAEVAVVLALVASGGGVLAAALGYAGMRFFGLAATGLLVRSHAPWLARAGWRIDRAELRAMAAPALALAMVPLGFAIQLQGMVAALGAVAGPAAVPVFTTIRTLSRFAIQLTSVVNVASMPEFTAASAREDKARLADLVAINLTTALALLVPAALIIAVAGPWIVGIWTGGAIVTPPMLAIALGAAIVAGGVWLVLANLILATNRQASYSYAFVMIAALGVAGCVILVPQMGVAGAGLAAAVADIAMLMIILVRAGRQGILSPGSFRDAPARSVQILRQKLGRKA